MYARNKFFVFVIVVFLMTAPETLLSNGEGYISVNPKDYKPLDERLYQPPTLKKICLLRLKNRNFSHDNIPEEVKIPAFAFTDIHRKRITVENLITAFNFCAPQGLQEKVSNINKKIALLDNFEEECSCSANCPPKNRPLFESIAWMLREDCHKDINIGLLQLSRYASCKKRKVLYAILLTLGADINYYGTTNEHIRLTRPLITAAIHNQASCVELLIRNKANIHLQEADGFNAYTLTKKRPNQTIANLLRSYGGIYIPVKKQVDNNNNEPAPKLFFGTMFVGTFAGFGYYFDWFKKK